MNLLERINEGFATLKAAIADLKASASTRADASTELTELKATVNRQEQEIAAMKAEKAEAERKLSAAAEFSTAMANAHTQSLAERDAEITRLKAEAKTAGELAAEMVAKQNIPISHLPAGQPAAGEADLEKLRAQIKEEKDPIKRGELAQKARELRGHADLFGKKK